MNVYESLEHRRVHVDIVILKPLAIVKPPPNERKASVGH